jgi:hypothetical protein
LTRIWALKGSRTPILKDQRFKCAYIFGAVCPASGKAAAILSPWANTDAMNEHLKAISAAVSETSHIALVIDQAGWHKADALIVPDNITLILLPPYSPELNGQEKIWQYLRDNYLSNRIFKDYDAVLDACQSAWNALVAMPDRIKSVAAKSWLV